MVAENRIWILIWGLHSLILLSSTMRRAVWEATSPILARIFCLNTVEQRTPDHQQWVLIWPLPMKTGLSNLIPGMAPPFFPFHKGNAIGTSMEVISTPNWAWQTELPCGGITPVTLFPTAASSRFVNLTNTTPSAAVHHQPLFSTPSSSDHMNHSAPFFNIGNIPARYHGC